MNKTIIVHGELRRKDGEAFPAGTTYEVLRENDDGTVNLCELMMPPEVGRTIVGVKLGKERPR